MRLLTYDHLKWASFAHSTVYVCLLVAWLVPGLHAFEFVFGLAHGLGWIAMCLLSILAVHWRVISIKLAVAVSVIGAIGPFIGSYEFARESRRKTRPATPPRGRYSQSTNGG